MENPRNTNYAHLFNMSDFDELQEVFDAILEILDQEDSATSCLTASHITWCHAAVGQLKQPRLATYTASLLVVPHHTHALSSLTSHLELQLSWLKFGTLVLHTLHIRCCLHTV